MCESTTTTNTFVRGEQFGAMYYADELVRLLPCATSAPFSGSAGHESDWQAARALFVVIVVSAQSVTGQEREQKKIPTLAM